MQSAIEACDTIFKTGIPTAHKLSMNFQELLSDARNQMVSLDEYTTIQTAFYFSIWAIANRVWSNAENKKLQKDLTSESMKFAVIVSAQNICGQVDRMVLAIQAARIEAHDFLPFAKMNQQALDEAGENRVAALNSIPSTALAWIQQKLSLSDDIMEIVRPQFTVDQDDFLPIENAAAQALNSLSQKKNIWARLFSR